MLLEKANLERMFLTRATYQLDAIEGLFSEDQPVICLYSVDSKEREKYRQNAWSGFALHLSINSDQNQPGAGDIINARALLRAAVYCSAVLQ